MTNGGPQGSSNVLVYYIYQTGFQFFRIGEAQAAATVLMMILALISFLNFKFFSNKIHYQ
jgi:sn-glycerol 3-phosphate transport system permease protein